MKRISDKMRLDWLELHGENIGLQFPGLSISKRNRMRWGLYSAVIVRTFSRKSARATIDAAIRADSRRAAK